MILRVQVGFSADIKRVLQVEVALSILPIKLPQQLIKQVVKAEPYTQQWYDQVAVLVLRCFDLSGRTGRELANWLKLSREDRDKTEQQPLVLAEDIWTFISKHLTLDTPPTRRILITRGGDMNVLDYKG